MLFNSYEFVFLFLPAVLVGYMALCAMDSGAWSKLWLLAASLFFYGWWNPDFVFLVLTSIVFNYAIGSAILRGRRGGAWLVAGIVGNLALLGYYKYFSFLIENINLATGWELANPDITLPIGISFFTFTQIAYLVDLRRHVTADRGLLSYGLFVTFFPHLIAGPIVHHRELAGQFELLQRVSASNLATGLGLFALGLFKKVVIADSLAPYVNDVFSTPATSGLTTSSAWFGAFAYSFQLYFDFSGYADMAVGLSRMFGIAMPCNFDSPYKSASIIEFWRRWHMTLSQFIRDYLYIPLGGSRFGRMRHYANLVVVMLCAGLWHGAGWTFVIWGGLHAVMLLANHAWRTWGASRLPAVIINSSAWGRLCIVITFVAVTSAWVVFRAESASDAWHILGLMYGGGVDGDGSLPWSVLVLLLALVWFTPNSQRLFGVSNSGAIESPPLFSWLLGPYGGVVAATVAFAAVVMMQRPSPFLYFQF